MKRFKDLLDRVVQVFYWRKPIEELWRLRGNGAAMRAFAHKQWKLGSDISQGQQFDEWPMLPHGLLGIFISGSAKIGAGCTIFQQVTIGSNMLSGTSHQGAPIIGKNCYIGAGAKIIGGICVGDGCRIGANAVVFDDVPPNSTVVAGGVCV